LKARRYIDLKTAVEIHTMGSALVPQPDESIVHGIVSTVIIGMSRFILPPSVRPCPAATAVPRTIREEERAGAHARVSM
jgi:hypothetical protein